MPAPPALSLPHAPCVAPDDHARWFEDQLQPHEGAVRGYLRSKFPDVDADDVVQESYLKLFKTKAAAKVTLTKAYFFAVVRNTAYKFCRHKKYYSSTPLNELPPWQVIEGGPDAAEAASHQSRMQLMTEAIDQLPPRCRDILRLTVVQGKTPQQIAAELGIADATVRAHLCTGIRKCADYLRERGERW